MTMRTRTEVLLLVAFCGFLFFYGRGSFGLVGADEPRYAQVAREMLERRDWITPTLQGKAWLEKPVLYYWEAILCYSRFGVTDSAARLPAAIDAALLIAAIYFFLRRFRPGGEEDGALITAGTAAMIGFARAAATDMPLAATFTIALLAWYAWHESDKRLYLAISYIFLALGTLAKGPIAPALAAVVILIFAAAKRDWSIALRTFWIPGVLLFLVVALPWYIAVQLRNPEFFRVFVLEHNLARFSSNLYHHPQPFWFYIPVLLLSLMPWTLWLILAVVERIRLLWSEGRNALSNPDDAWQMFLLIWLLVPVIFFSASQSKLPGYILLAIPAGALLVSEYIGIRKESGEAGSVPRLGARFLRAKLEYVAHAAICGLLVFGALSAASIQIHHRLVASQGTYVAAALALVITIGIAAALLSRSGLRLLRPATMLAIVIAVAAILRIAAPAIDASQSARPLAASILSFSHEPVPLAVFHVGRVQEYGLEFYLNRPARHYESAEIPAEAHVLVAPQTAGTQLPQMLTGRKISYLTSIPVQRLDVYWVAK